MSFGKQKTGNVKNTLTPYNFYTPDGNTIAGKNSITYQPLQNPWQLDTEGSTDQKINQLVKGAPTEHSPQEMFNNEFFGLNYDAATRNINSRKQDELRELENQLSAKNQLGSSYDALRKKQLEGKFETSLNDAYTQARLSAADAYNQSLKNRLLALEALRNDRSTALNDKYLPFQLAERYQSTLNPLQTALARYYTSQPTTYDNIQKYVSDYQNYVKNNADIIGKILGMSGGGSGGGATTV